MTPSGDAIGSLCVLDTKPQELDPEKLKELRFLATQVVTMMEKRAEFLGLFEQDKTSEHTA